MARQKSGRADVGGFVRRRVIPAGMSVTEAARRLGVGRPALSNLLNGRAALSANMALRLEATFGADRARLLELQTEADRHRRSTEDRAVPVGTYAPSFLTIEARRIEDWAATNVRARDRLPVLLRRLVHATGRELRRVDFPGYDNAQRHGWDGRVEADAATLWVPEGRSFWEFGVDQRPKAKADRDYRARLEALPSAERAKCTFIFVTPRNWPGKDEWARSREAAGDWRAVRALDASDLEQWVETTIAPRIWLAGELGSHRRLPAPRPFLEPVGSGQRTAVDRCDLRGVGNRPPGAVQEVAEQGARRRSTHGCRGFPRGSRGVPRVPVPTRRGAGTRPRPRRRLRVGSHAANPGGFPVSIHPNRVRRRH